MSGHSKWSDVKKRMGPAREMGRLLRDPEFRATLARVEFGSEKQSFTVIATEDDTCGDVVRRLMQRNREGEPDAVNIMIGHEGHCTIIAVSKVIQFEYVKGGDDGESGEGNSSARIDGQES